ncbi:MAG TPA: SLBB domain-containing protein [Gemmatimonadaceae bacterium]|nr:SLBB domain-containing protein [Gemmatimonadaceae bacterium]
MNPLVVAASLVVALATSELGAQAARSQPARASRVELEALAARYAQEASAASMKADDRRQTLSDEEAIRNRLRSGDFRVGDRIVLRVTGSTSISDTLSVTADRAVRIPEIGEVSLDGVLRSELQRHLDTEIARLIRGAVVTAEPLTRLAVLGEVRTPGFIHLPGESLLSDIISAAGGPTAAGSLDLASVRRAGKTLVPSGAFAKALASGATIEDLDIRSGDEVFVNARRPFNWTQLAQTTAILIGSAAGIIALQHR